ncbi:MAG: replication-relaxation family protein [Verrucomicrobiota bacterium]
MPIIKRLPRFRRDPEAAGSFLFTPRDLEILRHVAEHRFVRSEWITQLLGGSKQQVLRRLHLLYHHGYLDRPMAQLDYYHRGGSKSIIYGLASRGAGRLRRDLNMPFERMDWTTRNREVGQLFLEHTVLISDFIATQRCLPDSGTSYVPADDLEKIGGRQNGKRQFRWSVKLRNGRTATVVPDKVFALDVEHDDGLVVRKHFLVEADRGTMPIKRRDNRQSSIMQKLRTYHALSRMSGALPRNTFVVLLSASEKRLTNILEEIAKEGLPQRLFKISHYDDMTIRFPDTPPHGANPVNSR